MALGPNSQRPRHAPPPRDAFFSRNGGVWPVNSIQTLSIVGNATGVATDVYAVVLPRRSQLLGIQISASLVSSGANLGNGRVWVGLQSTYDEDSQNLPRLAHLSLKVSATLGDHDSGAIYVPIMILVPERLYVYVGSDAAANFIESFTSFYYI